VKKPVLIFLLISLVGSCGEKHEKVPEKADGTIKTKSRTTKEKANPYAGLSYSIITEKRGWPLKNDSLKKIINSWIKEKDEAGINGLADFILQLTANQLNFSFGKCGSDPSALIKKGDANCVGYAAFFNALMNYALQQKPFSKKYLCRHYAGKIYFAGQNINALFNDPFFKDHDFNIIKSRDGKVEIGVDPSLYEYMNVKRVLVRK
jgi:hypothetical protein